MTTECQYKPKCPMFARFSLDATKRFYAMQYCQADYQKCARYKLRVNGVPVPEGLLPDGSVV